MASCVNVYAGSVASDELVSGTLVASANRRHLIAITIHRHGGVSVATPSVSLWGLSWSLVESNLWDDTSGSRRGLFVFTAVTGGSPSSGALTVTSLAVEEIEISVVVDRIEGDIVGSIVQAKSHGIADDVSNLIDVTLDSAPGSNANMWTALGFPFGNGADNSITTDGFAVSAEATLEEEAGVATGFRASGSQTVQWSNIDSNSVIRTKGAVLVEIDATPQPCVNVYAGSVAGATLTSGSLTPTADRRYMLAIAAYRGDSTNPALPAEVSLWGLTWSLVESDVYDTSSSSRRRFYTYTAATGDEAPSAGALSITITSAAEIVAILDRIDGDIDGTVVQSESVVEPGDLADIEVTLGSAPASSGAMWSALGWSPDEEGDSASAVTAGFATVGSLRAADVGVVTAFRSTPSQVVDWLVYSEDASPDTKSAVLVEINATEPAYPPEIFDVTPDTFGQAESVVIEWGPPE